MRGSSPQQPSSLPVVWLLDQAGLDWTWRCRPGFYSYEYEYEYEYEYVSDLLNVGNKQSTVPVLVLVRVDFPFIVSLYVSDLLNVTKVFRSLSLPLPSTCLQDLEEQKRTLSLPLPSTAVSQSAISLSLPPGTRTRTRG